MLRSATVSWRFSSENREAKEHEIFKLFDWSNWSKDMWDTEVRVGFKLAMEVLMSSAFWHGVEQKK